MPNWNSCTMPVTTPIAMLIRKSLPQNLVALRYFSFSVRTQAVCRPAVSAASEIVSGTKRKW